MHPESGSVSPLALRLFTRRRVQTYPLPLPQITQRAVEDSPSTMTIKRLNDLGISITPKLAQAVIKEVKERLNGKSVRPLNEPLDQIIINAHAGLKYKA